MRNDLTHTMVHDLRGPLTSISISMELLQLMEQSPHMPAERRVQAVERAYASTQKLLGLVEAILELSRLESGHLSLNVQPFLISNVVNGVLDMQLPRAREKQIALVYCAPDALPMVNADQALMERVVQNLVDNAVKFTRPGGRVLVEALPTAVDAPFLDLVVTDTGCGIPLEMQGHLFEKFSRGMQQERGSGLGLYFCKMVVAAHDGRIWVARSDESGTAIQVSLPMAAGG
jgi:signal transduction histidine kinase